MMKTPLQGFLAAALFMACHATARADICSAILDKPGLYLKNSSGHLVPLSKHQDWDVTNNMWLWIVPDKPSSGLEVTWHVLVQTRLGGGVGPAKAIIARRNKVVSACDGRRENTMDAEGQDGAPGIALSYHDHNNNAGPGRPRRLPTSGGLRSWHFKWQDTRNDCPFTADHIEKAEDQEGNPVVGSIAAGGGGALALTVGRNPPPRRSSTLFTTVTSILVHRNADDFKCYSVPLKAGLGGETQIKVKRLKGGGASTYKLFWRS